jgi:hypothetical protein
LKVALEFSDWTPLANTAGRAGAHSPFVDVIVNASSSKAVSAFLNCPTAVQLPAVAHDTEKIWASGEFRCTSSGNTADRAGVHTPFVDVMVKARRPFVICSKYPPAVQFPGDAHDTELTINS